METGAIGGSSNPTGYVDANHNSQMGKDEFLKLLTAQLQHQDPMSPMSGQDFSAQLAQFSQVEQMSNMNATLEQGVQLDLMLTQAINNTLSTTIVGKQAKIASNSVVTKNIDGEMSSTVSFKLSGIADNVMIKIKDYDGNVVKTIDKHSYCSGEHSIDITQEMSDLPEADYTFEITALDNAGNTLQISPMMVGIVTGVRFSEDGSFLLIEDTEAPFSDVMEIGAPS